MLHRLRVIVKVALGHGSIPRGMRPLLFGFVLILLLPASLAAADCQFVLGFKTLRDLIGHEKVGECLENEHHGPNGDALQRTTGGLLVWRKTDNWTAFTDGYRTWINGPNGLVQRLNTERFPWEHDYAPGGGIATPTPTPLPTPSPAQIQQAEHAIAALPWVQDGLTGVETTGVQHLNRLAAGHPQLLHALLDVEPTWLPPKTGLHTTILARLVTMSRIDPVGMLQFIQRPFFKSVDYDSLSAVNYLTKGLETDPSTLQVVLSHPALGDGDAGNIRLILDMLAFRTEDPEAAAMIESLPWVQDGLADYGFSAGRGGRRGTSEQVIVRQLSELSRFTRPTFLALLAKPWMRDQLSELEVQTVYKLYDLAGWNAAFTQRLLAMPFLDTIEYRDFAVLGDFTEFGVYEYGLRHQIINHPDLASGITDDSAGTVRLVTLEVQDYAMASIVRALPWVQDGLQREEFGAVSALTFAAQDNRQLFQSIVQRSWVRDGLTSDETAVIRKLWLLVDWSQPSESAAALALFDMPFLESISGADAAALDALGSLHSHRDGSYLQEVLSHPTLRDGIRDEHTPLIAVLYHVGIFAPHTIQSMLDPGGAVIWERTLAIDGLGSVDLAVVSTNPEAADNIDWLEHAVHSHVEFMGTPLPKSFVALWVHERGGGGGGPTAILSVGNLERPDTVAHEAAHIYWPFAPWWIAEGAAAFLESVAESKRTGSPIEPYPRNRCTSLNTLLEYDQYALNRVPIFGSCEYVLGSGLFVDLYHSLGDESFRQSFRRLYLKLEDDEHGGSCTGVNRGECYVTAAFVTDASPEAAAIARPIINRWYYGSEHGP